jgi:hypothetical protein
MKIKVDLSRRRLLVDDVEVATVMLDPVSPPTLTEDGRNLWTVLVSFIDGESIEIVR